MSLVRRQRWPVLAGRYFGFVIGGTLPAALAASRLANTWDQNAAFRVMLPVTAEIEEVVLRWVCEIFGLRPDCEGGIVTCATAANFTALATARHALLARSGWDVAADGMFGAPPIEVVVGEEVHASVLKALNLAGFGQKRVTIVPADGQGTHEGGHTAKAEERFAGVHSGWQCEYGSVRSGGGNLPLGSVRATRGCTLTARFDCGPQLRRSMRIW